ncbi:MAG: hypothetical protein U0794_07480 [Isosphaeraceae bacterium]
MISDDASDLAESEGDRELDLEPGLDDDLEFDPDAFGAFDFDGLDALLADALEDDLFDDGDLGEPAESDSCLTLIQDLGIDLDATDLVIPTVSAEGRALPLELAARELAFELDRECDAGAA